MKKILVSLFILVMFIVPINVFALTENLNDMSITMDDEYWYTFTRDNLKNNSDLDELGFTYDQVKQYLESNSLYLDALLYDDDPNATIELMVGIKSTGESGNLNDYSDSDVELLGKSVQEHLGANSYSVKIINNFKYIYLEYYDSRTNQNMLEYYTVVNGNGYTIMIRKQIDFNEEDLEYINSSINSITFAEKSAENIDNDDSSDNWVIVVFILLILFMNALIVLYFYSKNKKLSPKLVKVMEVIGIILIVLQFISLSRIDTNYLFSSNNSGFEDSIFTIGKISYIYGYLYFGIIGVILLLITNRQKKLTKDK